MAGTVLDVVAIVLEELGVSVDVVEVVIGVVVELVEALDCVLLAVELVVSCEEEVVVVEDVGS